MAKKRPSAVQEVVCSVVPELKDNLEPISSLTLHPLNPRRGSTTAISESLINNMQYRPIVVQRSTRTVLAGNHTMQSAKALGWTHIAVDWTDAEGEAALAILVADNRTSDLASNNDEKLAELLKTLPDLKGTGYDDVFLKRLTSTLDSKLLFVEPLESNRGHVVTKNSEKAALIQIGKMHYKTDLVSFAEWVKGKTQDGLIESMKWPTCEGREKPCEAEEEIEPRLDAIVEGQDVEVAKLIPYPGSARKHNVREIAKSLKLNGQYRRVIVRAGCNVVVAGGGVVEAAKALKWKTVRAVVLELTDQQAASIHLVDNRCADLAHNDDAALARSLLSMTSIVGTGFNQKTLEQLLVHSGVLDDELISQPRVYFNIKCDPTSTCWRTPAEADDYNAWHATLMREGRYSDSGVKQVLAGRLGIAPELLKGS